MLASICLIRRKVMLLNSRSGTDHKVQLHEPVVGAHIFMIIACSVSYSLIYTGINDSRHFYRVSSALCIFDSALSLMLSAIITNII